MDFDPSDEQRLLKESVDRLVADHYGFDDRRRYQAGPGGFSEAMWARYAELGLLGLPFAEADGGFGGGPVETAIVMEAFGRGLVLEPYLATVVLAGGLLRHAADAGQKAGLVPEIAAGRLRLAFGYAEPQSRYDLFDVETRAERVEGGWRISGRKGLVLHGDSADAVIVTARTAGDRRDRAGIGLFLVRADAPGLTRQGYPTQDGLRAAELVLDGVRVGGEALIGDPGGALPVVERVADEAVAALCAEAVGCFDEMNAITLDYLKTRQQFGTTIGSFQVLQHRAVDMFVELEQSRSMALYAGMMADDEDPQERARAVSAAKVQIGKSARAIGREAIQLHGGVGMTMEHRIGHYFKRVTMLDLLLGDVGHHLARLAALDGLVREQA
ncbi:pimeloyl-CoA dehydrogenase, small subunit [Tistlia consotensis]|uniref:Pimeloyl-CoA dehydrogenase, small subunit n=1 Tax=Tistlia consotensis USBA 355 TaxID=560819 RepID=A0A1Y6BCP1_9PROT|nr:acyl-CoA dehydrogenase family protein [Tistlia consotensis]SMF04353.1 pimeloyl-CoA dehydrogenase, small subunit [Tistlia consotensis USBA 355]SNR54394.1 pimeloyl-CoA dehydrogenase, small subunit [Tistlia consotensis]